jgi:hypothetical protein
VGLSLHLWFRHAHLFLSVGEGCIPLKRIQPPGPIESLWVAEADGGLPSNKAARVFQYESRRRAASRHITPCCNLAK